MRVVARAKRRGRCDVHSEQAYYFLPKAEVAARLGLEPGLDARGRPVWLYRRLGRCVWVELHDYRIPADRAWLPEQHAHVGGLGTRLQAQAEAFLDLLAFRLHLLKSIERKYQVPGDNRWL